MHDGAKGLGAAPLVLLDFMVGSGLIENEFQNRPMAKDPVPPLKNVRVLAVIALLGVGALCRPLPAKADTADDVHRVLTLLSAAAEDYREGVQDGAVVRPIEWEEARASLQDARTAWERTASQFHGPDLAPAFDELTNLVGDKADVARVTERLSGLHDAVAAATGVSDDVYPPDAPSASRGKALFGQYCASCHGELGDGKGPSAAWLKPPPANFTDSQFMRGETPYDFYHVVSLGKRNTAMPAWDQTLSVQERWDVVAYVWTLAAAEATIAEGQGIYLAQCASCHGATGDGRGAFADVLIRRAPAFTQPQQLARRTDADLFGTISTGVAGSPMPGFGRTLSEEERWKAVAFIRRLAFGGVARETETAGTDNQVPRPARVAAGAVVEPAAAEKALAESRRLLTAGVAAYTRNDPQASAMVADAYMQFEPLEKRVGAVAPGIVQRTEEHFLRLRQMLRTPAHDADAQALAAVIDDDLKAVHAALQPHGSPYALFLESATIILREGLEVVLVVGALIAYVIKARNSTLQRSIYAGVGLGIAASFATAFVMHALVHLHPAASDLLEGMTMLLAAVVLFWVSYWLISRSEAVRWHRYIQGRVQTAVASGHAVALFSAAFLAVYREGFETVLFYQALYASAPAASTAISLGFVGGAVTLAFVYMIFRRFEIQIPVHRFFFVTGLFLYGMAAVFAGQGVHELQEAGLVAVTALDGVPTIPLLGVYPSVQPLAAQGVFVALLLYATWVTLRRRRTVSEQAETDMLTELRQLREVMTALRQDLSAMPGSHGSTSVRGRLEDLLVQAEKLAGRADVKIPGNGSTKGGGRH